MYEVQISITGDRIEAEAVKEVFANFLRLLRAIERQVATKKGAVRWRLKTLRYASPVVIGLVGEPRSRKKSAPDLAPAIGAALLEGMADLDAGRKPRNFSDTALEISKKLAASHDRRGAKDVLLMQMNGEASPPLSLTTRIVASVEELIGVKTESYGSVEGTLEVISSHGGITCNVYETLTEKLVRCEVPEHLKPEMLKHWERRVIVSGIVRRDKAGQPREISVREFTPVRDQETYVSIAGIAPDFTEGVDSVRYLKERWQ